MSEELEYYKVRDSSHIKIIKAMAEQIEKLEKELAFMEGEYPEPTIAAKIKEFSSLEQAYNRIAELEKQTKPLSDEEIYELWCEADNTELLPEMRMKDGSINYIITTFAKLIEERHWIK